MCVRVRVCVCVYMLLMVESVLKASGLLLWEVVSSFWLQASSKCVVAS